jgi:hypothetical protein
VYSFPALAYFVGSHHWCYKAELNGSEDNILFSDIIGIENTSRKKIAQVEGWRVVSTSERHQHVKRPLLCGFTVHIINAKYNHISYLDPY